MLFVGRWLLGYFGFLNGRFYYIYGFFLLMFVMLLVVSVCVSIVSVYVLLNAEDYRWHWLAFLCASSSAGYILLYSVYFFLAKTHMEGALQTLWFFAYVGMACLTLAMMTGSIGALGARIFITRIYSYTKAD